VRRIKDTAGPSVAAREGSADSNRRENSCKEKLVGKIARKGTKGLASLRRFGALLCLAAVGQRTGRDFAFKAPLRILFLILR